ncbi:hypothetical protein O1D97_06640 [Marinomonas sp. 15G1-11]|uniref:AlgX/AlgJ SGNH hydrolase-like domain-containing protein n=1 Tax=Marinomonas phaeophyticola TaxID=3004091 RepID=A0ABT4JSG9_9GAMM|nr:hypothetical protein [Marinomonas sp. 15G1-11]MCZ2721332.1 hypothetical protein [Marinomonas sp. 15G1-11]
MKKKIYGFLILIFLILTVAPLANWKLGRLDKLPEAMHWWHPSALYNMDFSLFLLGKIYYELGLSSSPGQVLVGKEGWLYLGNEYSDTISRKINTATDLEIEKTSNIAHSLTRWNTRFESLGVDAFRVILGPDKETIYQEYLPDWSQKKSGSISSKLSSLFDEKVFINPTTALLDAKNHYDVPLYFKSDSHWNKLGGGIAFGELSRNLQSTERGLKWPEGILDSFTNSAIKVGDLADIQRLIPRSVNDHSISIHGLEEAELMLTLTDYNTGDEIYSGRNTKVIAPKTPIRVLSNSFLNDKKVLWLRDSFGEALSPYMAMTFKDTLQVHHGEVTSQMVETMVATYKPDYVFMTVVERDIQAGFLTHLPTIMTGVEMTPMISSTLVATHDVKKEDNDVFEVIGEDVYFIYKLESAANAKHINSLSFDINCNPSIERVPMQLFWQTNEVGFSEFRSLQFSAEEGHNQIEINTPEWSQYEAITGVRLDINSTDSCSQISINSIQLGKSL